MVVSLYLLFEVLSTVFCLHYLYDEKIRIDVKTVGLILCEILWMQIIGVFHLNHNLSWLIYPIIIGYCGVKFGFCIKEIFINNILWMMIISILQVITILAMHALLKINHIGKIETLFINMFVFLIVAVGVRKWKLEKISKALQTNETIVVISLIMIMIGIVCCLSNYKSEGGFNMAYYIVLFVGLVMFSVVAVDIAKSKIKTREIEKELRLHKLYEESFQNLIDDIRARQHEFDNHINTIYSQHYLYSTYEELVEVQKKYCQNIVVENNYNKLLSKGNSMVIGFLYSKFSEAEKLGIDVEYKVQIGEMQSAIPMHKIIELLGNLINNAIEALVRQDNLNKMKVVVLEQPYEIAINIGNECRDIDYVKLQKFFKKGYSEKGKSHGYGLYNVKRICEEYGVVLESAIKKNGETDWLNYILIINKPL